MTSSQLFDLLLARWRLVMACTLVVAAVSLGISAVLPKKYSATATVIVDTRALDVLGNLTTDRSSAANAAIVATQLDLIGSERVARRVVRSLGLGRHRELRARWVDETGGKGDIDGFIARLIIQKLDVKINRESNVVRLIFTGDDSAEVQAIVNAIAREGVATNVDLKVEPANQATRWFDERNGTLRENLTRAQERLSDYQRDKGLVTRSDGGIDTENARLQQITEQLVVAHQARTEATSRYEVASRNPLSSIDVLDNATVASLRNSLANAEADQQKLQAQYRESYPALRVAREDVARLQTRVDREVQTVLRALETSSTLAAQREASLQAALDAQKAHVMTLMNQVGDARLLKSNVESAQQALDAATTRQSQTALEAKAQQSNLSLLSLADEPVRPSSPRLKLNTAIGAVFGALVGMGCALWLESRRPLVRCAEDFTGRDMLILAELPRVDVGQRRRRAPPRLAKPGTVGT